VRDPGGSPGSLRWAIAGVVGVLAAVNVLDNRVAHASLVVGPVGAAGLALAARRATVLFTGLSGVVFCELRRRSGNLLAPAGLHWATNGLAVLASAALWARSPR
jgi:membrane protease YdiL (CAAX protease family)